MNKQQLAAKIWESANQMRSKIEANEYKDYILGFIFYKYLSDKLVRFAKDADFSDEELRVLSEEDTETVGYIKGNIGYFIAYQHLFSTWIEQKGDFDVSHVRDALSAFSRLIHPNHKRLFEGVFKTLETGLSKLGDTAAKQTKAISELLQLIKDIPMDGKQGYDVLGFIYEYLISMFAANAGKKAGEFYTPHEVSVLMSEIIAYHLNDRETIQIYDSTSGSGSLLLNIGQSIAKHMADKNKIRYYAQELKENTYNLTRMNLVMRGIDPANIVTRNADTLEDDWPYFEDQDPVNTYNPLYLDAVVSNPPYSQKWDPQHKESDPRYARFGLAPKSKADYAFLLHDLYHLKPGGIMAIVLPHGVLFRGGEEGAIRKNLIENDHLETVIGLPPNIFFGTGIPTIILVLRQKRESSDVLFVDASKGFAKEGKNNKLRASDIKKITDTVTGRLVALKKAMFQKMFPRPGSTTPEIRFHGFEEAWVEEKVGRLGSFSKGLGYSKSDLADSGTPIVLYGRLYVNYETCISEVDTFQDTYEWLPDVVAGIKRLKEEMVTPADYRKSLPNLPASSDDVRRQREDVATLYECHERVLRYEKLVDFVDLVSKPAKALKDDRPQYGELADKFQYILVDEYQDVTFAMVELIRQLAKNAKSLWVVGDVRQAIHHWRGASVHSLFRFDQTFKTQGSKASIRTYSLEFNRRSSAEILEVVQQVGRCHVLEATALTLADTTSATGKVGDMPMLVKYQPATAMAEAVTKGVQRMHGEGVSFARQAVLARGNFEVEHIAADLRDKGIPVLYIGELAKRREVKKLLCLMQLLVERLPRAFVGLMGEPTLTLELDDLRILLEACAKSPLLQRGGWRDSWPIGLSAKSRAALSNASDLLRGQRRRSTPWAFVCDILLERRFGYPDISDESIDAHAARIALWQFAYGTRVGDGDGKIATLPRFLLRQQLRQRIGETYAERELPAEAAGLDAVHMLTVHGSKGLEFDAIHLANINIDDYGPDAPSWRGEPPILTIVPPEALRSTRKEWDFEAAVERNNLLYVGVSRARRYLLMYENGEDPRKRAPQLTQIPAPYKVFSYKGTVQVKERITPTPAGADASPMPFDEFEMYARCPLQHLYRHVLSLPSEQQVDIAIRARWAIMDALKSLAADPALDKLNVFADAWQEHKLPAESDDPQLWEHATEVFEVGAWVIEQSPGTYAEPDTQVDDFKIRLPWLLYEVGRKPSIEYLRFSGSLEAASKLWRPMLNGLRPAAADKLRIYSLLDGQYDTFKASGRISSTRAYLAVQKYRAGDQAPTTGKHCNWCAYSTLCPTRPV